MGKKIFIDTPRARPTVERLDERDDTCREFLSGSVGVRPKEKKRRKRNVKAQARMNRATSKRERKLKLRRKSTIDYVAGDLVYHNRRPEVPMLVMSIETRYHDAIVEVMLGASMMRYKAINLRKFEY
jgi:hypothetical protein